ncbi:MAG: AraC family transcriptional regulator [bacterium]|nr:AraC family transcriptional regulator [bacterium]
MRGYRIKDRQALLGSSVAGDVELWRVSAEPRPDLLITVAHIGRGKWGPRDRYERVRKQSYSVELVLGGSGVMDINGERHELKPRDMVLMHPDDTCIYWTGDQGRWDKAFISLYPSSLAPLIQALALDRVWHVHLHAADARRARQLFAEMLRRARQRGEDMERAISVGAYELLVILAGAVHRVRGAEHVSPPIRRAIDEAMAPRSTVRSVSDMASVAGTTREAFSKMFHRQMGVAPHEWLTRARMEQAAALLRTTIKPIHQIAEEIGYEDQFHFSRVFRRFAGVSPRKYREQCRRREQASLRL